MGRARTRGGSERWRGACTFARMVRARTAVCCCDALIVMQAGRALHTFLNVIAETFLTTIYKRRSVN